ncbi:MAG: YybH family protein [Ensifer adhaerens]
MLTHLHAKLVALGLLALPVLAISGPAKSDETSTAAITQQLQNYQKALNASDVDAVMKLYAEDAVFMPQHSLPAVGRDAVRSAYRRVFDTIKLDIRFDIDEVRALSTDWAYARTRSNGTVKVLSGNAAPMPEANQELFILHRETDGAWRFARYIFSTTNAPPQR